MPFAYYKRLSTHEKQIYRRSDKITVVHLPKDVSLHSIIEDLGLALKGEDRARTQRISQSIINTIVSRPRRTQAGKETPDEKKRRVRKIIKFLDSTYPNTSLALIYSNPLELMIALIMAAQCTDELVNKVTAELFPKYRTPHSWVNLDRGTLEQEIRPITFFRNKAKAIQACCHELINRFETKVPESLADLISLPGVGRKTANILRGNAFGHPAIGVDRHVGRLAQLMDLTKETNPDKIEFDLNPLVPDNDKVRFCHLLQKHGRTICLARKPNCSACPIYHLCPYPLEASIPIQKERPGET